MSMKFLVQKGLSNSAFIFFSVTTIISAVLGFFSLENRSLRIFTLVSLCLMMLFKGMNNYFTTKRNI